MAVVEAITRTDLFPPSQAVKVFLLPKPAPAELANLTGNPESFRPVLTKLEEPTADGTTGALSMNLEGGQDYLLWASVTKLSGYLGAATTTSATTSLGLQGLLAEIPSGTTITLNNGAGTTQTCVTAEAARVGQPTVAVTSFTPSIAFPVGTKVEFARDSYLRVLGGGVTGAGSIVPGSAKKVKVEITDTAVVAANATRKGLQIVNSSGSVIYLQLGATAVAEQGIFLAASGGSWDGLIGPEVWTGAVRGIAITSPGNVTVAEV